MLKSHLIHEDLRFVLYKTRYLILVARTATRSQIHVPAHGVSKPAREVISGLLRSSSGIATSCLIDCFLIDWFSDGGKREEWLDPITSASEAQQKNGTCPAESHLGGRGTN
jgi:hypothetical protein